MALDRTYPLTTLARLKDVLAEPTGVLQANYVFSKAGSGRAEARVSVRAAPRLICQRCLQAFEFPVKSSSVVEFSDRENEVSASGEETETFVARGGIVSLRELAEEELLLALPIVAACTNPETCGHVPVATPSPDGAQDESRRPFAELRQLLNKT